MNRNNFLYLLMLLCISFIAPNNSYAKNDKEFVVVLDAGHGGGDVGTPHRKRKRDEKTIALDMVIRIGKLIRENHKNVKVVYTRVEDEYPTLPERTKIAKEAQGDLFISIHVNAATNKDARGIETYIFGVTGLKGKTEAEQKRIRERMANERENLDISGKQVDFDKDMDIETKILCQAQREKNNIHSEEVANYVQKAMVSSLKRTSYKANVVDRGVKEKNIFVLCYSPMPAILVELGYMSNAEEEIFLNTEEAMEAFAKGIYDGFLKYKNSWEKRKLLNDTDNAEDSQDDDSATEKNEDNPENIEIASTDNTTSQASETSGDKTVSTPDKQTKSSDKVYKIQYMSSKKLLKAGDRELHGITPLEYYKQGSYYCYTYGHATSREELEEDLKRIRKHFPDAFVIKTNNKGKREN